MKTLEQIEPSLSGKSFKNNAGVKMHQIRMHDKSGKWSTKKKEIEISPIRTSALVRVNRLRKLWLNKASTEKDVKTSKAIFECLLDLTNEFNK